MEWFSTVSCKNTLGEKKLFGEIMGETETFKVEFFFSFLFKNSENM